MRQVVYVPLRGSWVDRFGWTGVGASPYAGRLHVGVTADRETYADLDVLAAAMRDEFEALRALARPVPDTRSAAA